jgi:predicted DNA-binding protein
LYNDVIHIREVKMPREMRSAGKVKREKAISMAMKRKEEYLGARVPKELRDRVILRAKELGIPVSILIRNILEEEFKESASDASMVSSSAKSASGTNEAENKFSSVIGWERIQLNKTVACSGCGVELRQGKQAELGVGGPVPVVLCRACRANL